MVRLMLDPLVSGWNGGAPAPPPDVDPDPVPKPPPDTGLDYLALLRAERERLLQQQLETIHFTQLPQPKTDQSKEVQNDDQSE